MAIWIVVFCRQPLGRIDPDALKACVLENFDAVAWRYDEYEWEREDIRDALRVSEKEFIYSAQQTRPVFMSHYKDTKDITVSVQEELANLEDITDEEANIVRAHLHNTREIIAFELKPSDCEGMAWALIMTAAACLAEQGDGLVRVDEVGWQRITRDKEGYLIQTVLSENT